LYRGKRKNVEATSRQLKREENEALILIFDEGNRPLLDSFAGGRRKGKRRLILAGKKKKKKRGKDAIPFDLILGERKKKAPSTGEKKSGPSACLQGENFLEKGTMACQSARKGKGGERNNAVLSRSRGKRKKNPPSLDTRTLYLESEKKKGRVGAAPTRTQKERKRETIFYFWPFCRKEKRERFFTCGKKGAKDESLDTTPRREQYSVRRRGVLPLEKKKNKP